MGKKTTRKPATARPPSPPAEDDGTQDEFVSKIFTQHSDYPFYSDTYKVGFDTEEELEQFFRLARTTHKNTLWVNIELLELFGCKDSLVNVLDAIGITDYVLGAEPSYPQLTNEFLASFCFNAKATPQTVKFQIWGKKIRITLQTLANILDVPNTGLFYKLPAADEFKQARVEMWKRLTHDQTASNINRNSSMGIRNPALRLICRIIIATIFPLPENGHTCPQSVIQLLMDALYSRTQALSIAGLIAYHLHDHSTGKIGSNKITVGGIVTKIAKEYGFDPAKEKMTPVAGPYILQVSDMKWLIKLQRVSRHTLAKITEKRALVLPNGPRLDPLIKDNWGMPYGTGEYELTSSNIGRAFDDIWRPSDYEPLEGVVQYEEEFNSDFPSDSEEFEYPAGVHGPSVSTARPPPRMPQPRPQPAFRRAPEREPSPVHIPSPMHHTHSSPRHEAGRVPSPLHVKSGPDPRWDRLASPFASHFGAHFEQGGGSGTHQATGHFEQGQSSHQEWEQEPNQGWHTGSGFDSSYETGTGSGTHHRNDEDEQEQQNFGYQPQNAIPYHDFDFFHEANRTYYHRDERPQPVNPQPEQAPGWFTEYRNEQRQIMNSLCNSMNSLEVGLHQHMTQYDQDSRSLQSTIIGMRQDMSVLNDNMHQINKNQFYIWQDVKDTFDRTNDNFNLLSTMYHDTYGYYPQDHNPANNPYASDHMDTDQPGNAPPHPYPTSPGGGPL